ncbi:hypothetical protein V6R21_18930 [Limibacter armeniacum]|uniref:hypothetical protein n=1 Tax=Limibacter armeniacum TaxID=466084 RepID=UPI002FE67394
MNQRQRKYFYVLLKKLGLQEQKGLLVLQYTEGRTDSTAAMSQQEVSRMLDDLGRQAGKLPVTGEQVSVKRMRSKILHLAGESGFAPEGQINWDLFNGFMERRSYLQKPLGKYAYKELPRLVSQFEQMADNFRRTRFNAYLQEELKNLKIGTR